MDARILHGDLSTPYQGELTGATFNSFGWGPRREYLTGLPHVESVDFDGALTLRSLGLPFLAERTICSLAICSEAVDYTWSDGVLTFTMPVYAEPGAPVQIEHDRPVAAGTIDHSSEVA